MSFIKRAALGVIKPYISPYVKGGLDAADVSFSSGKLHLTNLVRCGAGTVPPK